MRKAVIAAILVALLGGCTDEDDKGAGRTQKWKIEPYSKDSRYVVVAPVVASAFALVFYAAMRRRGYK